MHSDRTAAPRDSEVLNLQIPQDQIATRNEMISRDIPATPLLHLIKRSPVDIEFSDLTYSVPVYGKGM